VSKIFGFLLGVVVALAGPAAFGVLAAQGGIELNAKEMALAYGIGALIFWAVVSYFSGAAALGAFVVFGAMIYAVHWIPNRMTNFLNDIPGVTNGMIDGIKQYTQNGMVPVLAVISLIYAIQLIVRSVQKRRRLRAEADRLQREQELAQAQQEAEVTAQYPLAYPTTVDNRYGSQYDEPYSDDPYREDPAAFLPGNYSSAGDEQTTHFAGADASTYEPAEDETTQLPIDEQGDDHPDEARPPAGKAEQFGQQYRERMDGPHLEDSAEHQFGAFDNPMEPGDLRPQAPVILDLPRPASA
jgi:heme exporter protein D